MKEAQDKLLHSYGQHNKTVKPYVVIQGQNLGEIKSAYVVIANHNYKTDRVFDAVDLCFQMHQIFFESYSFICNHVWQFIGSQVYKFE